MTLPAPTYDLVLLLDPQVEEPTRAKLIADARAAIEAQGELLRHDNWGERPLAYPIDRKASAEYHLLQFHVSTTELLNGLDRTLRLADEVLRFRIVKLAPGVSSPPDMSSGTAGARRDGAETPTGESPPATPPPASAEPAGEQPAEAEAGAEAEATEVPVGDAS